MARKALASPILCLSPPEKFFPPSSTTLSNLSGKDIISVSYTHLDVYKRQVVGQKKDEENNNSEFFKKIENYFKGEN